MPGNIDNKLLLNTSSNGDDKEQRGSSLEEMLRNLAIGLGSIPSFKKFTGSFGEDAVEFLRQFKPFLHRWSDDEILCHEENALQGKAKLWAAWAKNEEYQTREEFENQLTQRFSHGEISQTQLLIEKLKSFQLKQGKIQEGLLEILCLQKKTTVPLKDIIPTITKELPALDARRLISLRKGKDMIDTAQEMDEDFWKDKRLNKEKSLHKVVDYRKKENYMTES